MLCPTDQTVLVMAERKGVEIDYCPTCRGVWLDRGELDKIIDRSVESEIAAEAGGPVAATPPPAAAPGPTAYPPAPPVDYGSPHGDDRRDGRRPDDRYRDDRYRDDRRDDRYRDDRRDDRYRGDDRYGQGYDPRYRKRKKKESWLEDLFDF
ncbi:TFIIB-type zinc ribbon-containing protein [Cellulosimicrobium marinum]|uniref:TFIIB-type zinc ribbon-containing protein n=1 Tax=Cellulosimicrobium marinum TaxID=1638992 RepID=UPI001E51C4E7|nr:zf-TFIIB domain-containing protein [Cellulosimicrobium marinum]MCB7136580.1 zf-TFIIB domain-containing protein [Cellulosimicrobium marinum]